MIHVMLCQVRQNSHFIRFRFDTRLESSFTKISMDQWDKHQNHAVDDRVEPTQNFQSSTQMQIFVKDLEGKTRTFMVQPSDTVLSLKEKVQDKLAIPVNTQRLVYAGRNLNDDCTLHGSGIRKHFTLQLLLRFHS